MPSIEALWLYLRCRTQIERPIISARSRRFPAAAGAQVCGWPRATPGRPRRPRVPSGVPAGRIGATPRRSRAHHGQKGKPPLLPAPLQQSPRANHPALGGGCEVGPRASGSAGPLAPPTAPRRGGGTAHSPAPQHHARDPTQRPAPRTAGAPAPPAAETGVGS